MTDLFGDALPRASVLVARRPCGCGVAGLVYDHRTRDAELGAFYRDAIDRGLTVERMPDGPVRIGGCCEVCKPVAADAAAGG